MLTVKFTDGELVQNVDWKSLPNKPIRYMDYSIWGKTIRLMGYERYLRLKEINEFILVGQSGMICDKLTIDIINKKIFKQNCSLEEVYNKPTDIVSWKVGQILDNPNIFINGKIYV